MDQREQGTAAQDEASSPAKPARGPKAGNRFGETRRQGDGGAVLRATSLRIGSKGGRTMRDRHGPEFYAEIGKRGGQTTRDTRGHEFYARIGRLGGQRGRGVPKRQASDRLYEQQHRPTLRAPVPATATRPASDLAVRRSRRSHSTSRPRG